MKLAVFDIDGTLVQYHRKRNDRAYIRALLEVFGVTQQDGWTGFTSSTDSGILREIVQRKVGRDFLTSDRARFKESMARWLTAEYGSDSFEPATGALQAWNELSTHPVWKRAVATGNWEFSARYKLSHAGYELRGVPLASADDGEAREQVLEAAKKKSLSEYGCAEFDKVVYIGDWIWDVKAAKALGWEFIGIAKNEDAHTLRYAGAERILQDFMGLIPELEKL